MSSPSLTESLGSTTVLSTVTCASAGTCVAPPVAVLPVVGETVVCCGAEVHAVNITVANKATAKRANRVDLMVVPPCYCYLKVLGGIRSN